MLELRHDLQNNARLHQPDTPLPDQATEADEMFQNVGEKGEEPFDPTDPPRQRANNRCGRGTYAHDRPPLIGTVGRETGQVHIRMACDTTRATVEAHVHRFTLANAQVCTNENPGYNHLLRPHATVCHAKHEYARDEDGDDQCEVHCNAVEGLWTDVRNFLHPFKGVHKKYLAGYVAIAEAKRNLKRISPGLLPI